MKVLLASPHGFCAGVVMAIKSVERALELLGTPLYVYHEIVHNKHVVERFQHRGVVFVNSIEEVPVGSTLLFSAHGVSPAIRDIARQRRLFTIDATCPLVAKVHGEAIRFARQGYTILLIGHEGHDEIVGVLGEAPERIILVESVADAARVSVPDPERVAYLTQTTLSVDDANQIIGALKSRFPRLVGPPKEDICYATQNRQEVLRALAREVDVVLVVGSQNSSNSQRLAEVARQLGTNAHLIDDVGDIDPRWLEGVESVGLTAGASAPEHLVRACLDWLETAYGARTVESIGAEHVEFPLPAVLRPMGSLTPVSPA